MPGEKIIGGDRINLCATRREDREFVHRLLNSPETSKYLSDALPDEMSSESWLLGKISSALKKLLSQQESKQLFVITRDGEMIGIAGLHSLDWVDGKAHCFVCLDQDHQGQGYGTESLDTVLEFAFRELRLNRVYAKDVKENEAAVRMNEKLGFEREGELRESRFIDGEYRDEVLFGILREEWEDG